MAKAKGVASMKHLHQMVCMVNLHRAPISRHADHTNYFARDLLDYSTPDDSHFQSELPILIFELGSYDLSARSKRHTDPVARL